jgi:hypothetical protein
MSLQQAIEMILTRQLASYLALPICVVDPEEILVADPAKSEAE